MIQFNQLIVFKILCFTRVCQKWWIQSLVQWKPHSPGQISQSRTWADIFAFVLSCIINKQTNKQTNQTKQTNKPTKTSQSGTWADVSEPALLCSQQTACSQASAPPWREFDSFLKYSIRNTERQKPEFVCWETSFQLRCPSSAPHCIQLPAAVVFFATSAFISKLDEKTFSETQGHKKLKKIYIPIINSHLNYSKKAV